MKEIIWDNKYIYNDHLIPPFTYGLLIDKSDDSVFYVYGISTLMNTIEWCELKYMSSLIESKYKEYEELHKIIDEL